MTNNPISQDIKIVEWLSPRKKPYECEAVLIEYKVIDPESPSRDITCLIEGFYTDDLGWCIHIPPLDGNITTLDTKKMKVTKWAKLIGEDYDNL